MPSDLTLGDAIYIYERIGKIAYELQRTRSTAKMFIGGFRAALSAAHIPVGIQTQNLSYQQLEKKAFYDAVGSERAKLSRSYSGSKLIDMNWKIREVEAQTMMSLANYVLSGRGEDAATGLANMEKISIWKEQIKSRLLGRIYPNVPAWQPDMDELRKLGRQYEEGR